MMENPRHRSSFQPKPIFKFGLREVLEHASMLEQKLIQQRRENKLDISLLDTLAYCYLQAREIGYLQKSVALYGEILYILYGTPLSGMQLDYAVTLSNLAYAKFNLEVFSNITSETNWQHYPSLWRYGKVSDPVLGMFNDASVICDRIGYTGIEVVNIIEKDLSARIYSLHYSLNDLNNPVFKESITQRLNRAFTLLNAFGNGHLKTVEYANIQLLMAKFNGFILTKHGYDNNGANNDKVLKQQTITAFDSVLECFLKVYGPLHPKYIYALAYKSYSFGFDDEECTKFAIDSVQLSSHYFGELYIEVLVFLYIAADRIAYKTHNRTYSSYLSPVLFQKSNEIRRRYGIKEERSPF